MGFNALHVSLGLLFFVLSAQGRPFEGVRYFTICTKSQSVGINCGREQTCLAQNTCRLSAGSWKCRGKKGRRERVFCVANDEMARFIPTYSAPAKRAVDTILPAYDGQTNRTKGQTPGETDEHKSATVEGTSPLYQVQDRCGVCRHSSERHYLTAAKVCLRDFALKVRVLSFNNTFFVVVVQGVFRLGAIAVFAEPQRTALFLATSLNYSIKNNCPCPRLFSGHEYLVVGQEDLVHKQFVLDEKSMVMAWTSEARRRVETLAAKCQQGKWLEKRLIHMKTREARRRR